MVTRKIDIPVYNKNKVKALIISYEEPEICPICQKSIKPVELFEQSYTGKWSFACWAVLYFCKGCYNPFVANYYAPSSYGISTDNLELSLDYIAPKHFIPKKLSEEIVALSPNFIKIYNEALTAEFYSLTEIAGVGFRKSLEFLIKDYAIYRNPDEDNKIKKMPLAQCINNHICNDKIKKLSSRAAWIGNDETHYIRKHSDRDIVDLKKFINATLHYIEMELIVDEAASMEP